MEGMISGIILAGGKSRRMGRDKAFLKIKGKRLIDITLALFKTLFDRILIVTDDKSRFKGLAGVTVCEDLVRERGPLAGIYTGLLASPYDKAFFAACDMPHLDPGLIGRMLDLARASDADCLVPLTSRGPEPLFAIYSKRLLPKIEAALKTEDLSLRGLLKECGCRYVQVSDPESLCFANINTPRDLKDLE